MPFDHDLDTDFGVCQCDSISCNRQEGFSGRESDCRKLAKSAGWRFRPSLDGPILICPECSESDSEAEA